MTRIPALTLLAFVLLVGSGAAFGDKPGRKPAAGSSKAAVVRRDSDDEDTRFYRYKLNNSLGINIASGSALVIASQFGLAIDHTKPWYVGPELNFSLFSPGNVLAILAGTWYEMRVFGSPRMSIALGGVVGPGFASQIANTGGTVLVAFLDAVIAQDIDDLVTVRGQFRPGIIGGYFAFQMNFNVSFRFL